MDSLVMKWIDVSTDMRVVNELEYLLKKINPIEKSQDWIPVSERLPDNWDKVLWLFDTKIPLIKILYYVQPINQYPWNFMDWYTSNYPKFWMQFPEPPKEKPN